MLRFTLVRRIREGFQYDMPTTRNTVVCLRSGGTDSQGTWGYFIPRFRRGRGEKLVPCQLPVSNRNLHGVQKSSMSLHAFNSVVYVLI